MTNLIRKGEGKPLRAAMKRKGLSAEQLAAATKSVDVTGRGISAATVWKVTGSGSTATTKCRLRTAWLMATAMDEPLQEHFDMPTVSTDTVERSSPNGHSR
ncbi:MULTISPECIES: XRE family transcriptional regulator [unclassified Streptomyces]|uniref:XRE family transcriptional regulator n=1 Tax=unclassified Streptomyces TaxID=2593676 RepID=UPI002E0F8A81|nr:MULTISPECIES: XRE family transcriptional regulator [unclassified Streptomyces]WSJ97973.1 XRE family transcriptional regulator [Streptomyces sp. NBC_01320]WTE51571.1 XRE family transcriptional regulator [Streptomyces sp. NBC_01620]